MEADEATIEDLFQSKIVYEVPRYQRQYVWDEKSQWQPLWQDVKNIAERLIDGAEEKDGEYTFDEEIVPHFMGAVVIKRKDKISARSAPTRIVVDGQQRLTTILLMMKAMSNVLDGVGQIEHADILRELTHNTHYRVQDSDAVKLRPTGIGYNSFRSLMNPHEEHDTIDSASDRLDKCCQFYEDKIMEWFISHEDDLDLSAYALRSAVAEKLQVARITLAVNDNEHEIFESLNARGISLTEFDKSKNHMLHHALKEIGEQDEFYKKYLERFDSETWWSERYSQPGFVGVGNRSNALTWYWITVMKRTMVKQEEVYQHIRQYIENKNDIINIAESFYKYADAFEELEKQLEDYTKLGSYHHRRSVLKIGQFAPMFMALYVRLRGRKGIFTNCMQIFDNYLMRRMMYSRSANGFRSLIPRLLIAIDDLDDIRYAPHALIDQFMSLNSVSNKWPTDEEISNRMLNSWFPKNGVARLVLEEVERLILPTGAAYRHAPRDLTLEHIMPEDWEDNWHLHNRVSSRDRQRRLTSISSIGNFTLLRKAMNSTLSNSSYERKLEYFKLDNLELNKHLVAEYPDVWNEDTIRERGEWILSKVFEIWPHGDALKQKFKIK